MRRSLFTLAAAAVSCGCSFSGAPPSKIGDSGAGSDGGIQGLADSGPATGACGSPGAMRATFDSGKEPFFLRPDEFGPLAFDGGLELQAAVAIGDRVETRYAMELVGHAIGVEIAKPMTGIGRARFLVTGGNTDQFGFAFEEGLLEAVTRVDGTVDIDPFAYLESEHRFLQVREDNGTVFLEASATGEPSSFVPLAEVDVPVTGPVHARFAIATVDGIGGGTVRFDNLNMGAEIADWCPPSVFVDTFDGGGNELDDRWLRVLGERCDGNRQGGGSARFDQAAGGNPVACFNRTRAAHDLTAGPASMEALDISPTEIGEDWRVFLQATAPDGSNARIAYIDDRVCPEALDRNGVSLIGVDACIDYVLDSMEFFRLIMPTPGTVSFEYSVDSVIWIPLHQADAPFDGRAVDLRIGTSSLRLGTAKDFSIRTYN